MTRAVPAGVLAKALLLALVVVTAPAAAHTGQNPDDITNRPEAAQLEGHKPNMEPAELDPLSRFSWVGPKGTAIEAKPCEPAWKMTGYSPPVDPNYDPVKDAQDGNVAGPRTMPGAQGAPLDGSTQTVPNHIGHLTGLWGLNTDGAYPEAQGVDFFHVAANYGSPTSLENSGNGYTQIGYDGFIRARMTDVIYDGEGRDIKVGDVHNYSSYCVYGAPHENGPYLFIGTAFKGYPDDYSATYLDLKFFYTDLWKAANLPGSPYAQYLMLVGSIDKWPVLKVEFAYAPQNPIFPGTIVEFTDMSEVYGWPAKSLRGSGLTTTDQIQDNEKDNLETHEWWFDSDATERVSFTIDSSAPDFIGSTPGGNPNPPSPPYLFIGATGDFRVCERVTTKFGLTGVHCVDLVAQDQPPEAAFVTRGVGCYFPEVGFTDKSRVSNGDRIVVSEWDFGDGTLGTGIEVAHTYEASGKYLVRHRVVDEDGQESWAERTVFAIGADECGVPPTRSGDEGADPSNPQDSVDERDARADFDGDGVPDAIDSCPTVPNVDEVVNMVDLDGDGVGDACDPDRDGDGVRNDDDTCADAPQAAQSDVDRDGFGDVCDSDPDGDGVVTRGAERDVCEFVADPLQADLDGDGEGDLCDGDLDGDLVPNAFDAFPLTLSEWVDFDGNGVGDNQDLIDAEAAAFGGRTVAAAAMAGRDAPGVGPWALVALAAVATLGVGFARRR